MAETVKSLFGDMFKTPDQIRQEQMAKLREQGRMSAGMMLSSAPQSGLARAIAGHAAGIAERMPAQTEAYRRALLGAGGIAAGAAGKEGLSNVLSQAAMTPEERQAAQTQQIVAQTDQTNIYSVKKAIERFRQAGNAKGVMLMQGKLEELQQRNLDRARDVRAENREDELIRLRQRGMDVQEETLQFNKDKQDWQESVANRKGTILSAAQKKKFGFAEGDVVAQNVNGNFEVLKEAETGNGVELKNVVWATDGTRTFRMGNTSNGTAYEISGGGIKKITGDVRPVTKVTRSDDPIKDRDALINQSKEFVGQAPEALDAIEVISSTLQEATDNPEAMGTFKRSFTKLAGPDSQISKAEIDQVTGGGSIATRIENAIKIGLTGTFTEDKVADLQDAIDVVKQIHMNRLAQGLNAFRSMYAEEDATFNQKVSDVMNNYRRFFPQAAATQGQPKSAADYIQEAQTLKEP